MIILGQRFFAQFTLAEYVNRTDGLYTIIVTGGQQANTGLEGFAIIISSTVIVIIFLTIITVVLLIMRKKRLEAE